MVRLWKWSSLSVVGLLPCLGCEHTDVSVHYHDDSPRHVYHQPVIVEREPVIVERTIVVPAGHVCTSHCDHYYHGGHYVLVERGHVHCPGCGHEMSGGKWISVRAKAPRHAPPQPEHRGPEQPERKQVSPPRSTRE